MIGAADGAGQTALAWWTGALSFHSPARTIARLYAFSLAEDSTMIELEAAANLTRDPIRAAAYLRHAADEARHARMFTARARSIASDHGLVPPPPPTADTSALLRTLGEIEFLAFVHRGESRGRARFEGWERTFRTHGDLHTASLFAALVEDERRHETYSRELLVTLAGEAGARKALRRVAIRSAWQSYLRLASATSRALYHVFLWALAPLLFALGIWTRWMLPVRSGWQEL